MLKFIQKHYILFFLSSSIIFLFSCSKSDNNITTPTETNTLILINSQTINSSPYKVETYINTDSIIVGYNPITLKIKDTTASTYITNATILFDPLMTANAGMHRHSGPVEQPTYSSSNNGFTGAFMPIHGSTMSYDNAGNYTGWTMRYAITINNIVYDTVKYNFATKSIKVNTQFFTSVAGNDGYTYYMALVTPQQASQKIGLQDLEVSIYRGDNHEALSFTPINNLTITNFYPYMPDMGHSSENNTTPKNTTNGHYKGTVNFTMGGAWTLNFIKIMQNGSSLIDSTRLEIAF